MMNMNEELMAKARGAKSVEELIALAKENSVELTEESAKEYFEQMNKTGELEDDELDSVAGGGCGKKVVTDFTSPVSPSGTCSEWEFANWNPPKYENSRYCAYCIWAEKEHDERGRDIYYCQLKGRPN